MQYQNIAQVSIAYSVGMTVHHTEHLIVRFLRIKCVSPTCINQYDWTESAPKDVADPSVLNFIHTTNTAEYSA